MTPRMVLKETASQWKWEKMPNKGKQGKQSREERRRKQCNGNGDGHGIGYTEVHGYSVQSNEGMFKERNMGKAERMIEQKRAEYVNQDRYQNGQRY